MNFDTNYRTHGKWVILESSCFGRIMYWPGNNRSSSTWNLVVVCVPGIAIAKRKFYVLVIYLWFQIDSCCCIFGDNHCLNSDRFIQSIQSK